MKTKVWLTRTQRGYELWASRPFNFFPASITVGGYITGKFLIGGLCPRMTKKCFGLKKHLKTNSDQILEGTMEFKFKEK